MITTLIFDFGDVFINLDKRGAMQKALRLFDLDVFSSDIISTNIQYETGQISTEAFLQFYSDKFPHLKRSEIIDTWNTIIKDFPEHRLEFISKLATNKNFKLILLSNTNALHIDYVKETVPFFEEFEACFDAFYLSHEIKFRKPNIDIFEFVLREQQITANECLFIDDTSENTFAAAELNFNVWNIDETKQDIVDLFKLKSDLF